MTHKKGDTFKADVTILKEKKGKPTVVEIGGKEYVLRHKDQFKGGNQK